MTGLQFSLDLPPRPGWDAENFFVSASNRAAFGFVTAWPAWVSAAAVIVGPPGCGKSHLAAIWQAKSGALVTSANVLARAAQRLPDASLVIEDADRGIDDERAFFHLLNHAAERGRSVLMTARLPPAAWQITLPDLRSRVCACPLIAITEPDDALLSAVIVKHFADRHLTPSPETVKYIVARMERSMEQAGIIAARLDRLSLAERRPVTRALAATLFANEAMVEDENVA